MYLDVKHTCMGKYFICLIHDHESGFMELIWF